MIDILTNFENYLTYIFEIIAAITGSYYLSKNKDSVLRIFVYYLWLTVFVEIIGSYTYLLLNNYDVSWFINIKNSVFCYNIWLYNIYAFLAIGLIGLFYSNLMTNIFFKSIIMFIFVTYVIFAFVFFTFSEAFFVKSLPYNYILGGFVISVYVVLYFIELMRSEELLDYYRLPSFYISIALLIWYLCAIPLFIFSSYFYDINSNYVEFRSIALLFINIFTYSCYTFGFLYSLKRSKQ